MTSNILAGAVALAASLAASGAGAQRVEEEVPPTIGFSFTVGNAIGELGTYFDQGFGGQVHGVFPLHDRGIVRLRGDLGFLIYGVERQRHCFPRPGRLPAEFGSEHDEQHRVRGSRAGVRAAGRRDQALRLRDVRVRRLLDEFVLGGGLRPAGLLQHDASLGRNGRVAHRRGRARPGMEGGEGPNSAQLRRRTTSQRRREVSDEGRHHRSPRRKHHDPAEPEPGQPDDLPGGSLVRASARPIKVVGRSLPPEIRPLRNPAGVPNHCPMKQGPPWTPSPSCPPLAS